MHSLQQFARQVERRQEIGGGGLPTGGFAPIEQNTSDHRLNELKAAHRRVQMRKKVCQRCGAKYLPTGSNQKYCSDVCAEVAQGRRDVRRRDKRIANRTCVCQVCQQEFYADRYDQKYCGGKCRYAARLIRKHVKKMDEFFGGKNAEV